MSNEKIIKSLKRAAIIVGFLLFVYFLFFHTKTSIPAEQAPVVSIQKPIIAKIGEYVTQTGNTVAYNSVDLVARVEGYLEQVKFTDGTFIKKGQSLFVIEPAPYMEKLKQEEAHFCVFNSHQSPISRVPANLTKGFPFVHVGRPL